MVMDTKLYRFVCRNIGVYEAVDKYCPRDDERRRNKPDGSWLPKVGTKYPGAISYWTERGLKKYIESGLYAWHTSVIPDKVEVYVSEPIENPLYNDELQVIDHLEKFTITRTESVTGIIDVTKRLS